MSSPTNHNILQTEQSFQQLKSQVRSFSSERIRLVLYERFFNGIQDGGPPQRFLSYFQELVGPLLELLKPENLSYSSPKYLRSLHQTMNAMKMAGLAESSSQEFQGRVEMLKKHLLGTFCYLGEFDQAQSLLGIDQSTGAIEQGTNLEKFRSLINTKPTTKHSEVLHEIYSAWESMVAGSSTETVWIPLVEKVELQGETLAVPMIQPLSVKVEQRSRQAGEHLIFFNNYPIANNSPIYYQAYDAVHVAAKQLHRSLSRNKPYFRVMFGFPETEYFYTGESFGLGMALVASAAFQKAVYQRVQVRVKMGWAITGMVDMGGSIRAVSGQSIENKLHAVYYSPFDRFIIPQKNENNLKSPLVTLKKEHPGKDIQLQYAEEIEATFNHNELSHMIRIPLKEWTQTHVRRSQVIQLVVVLALLIAFLWAGWWWNRDLNPENARIENGQLHVYNQDEQLLWIYDFGFPLMNLYHQPGGLDPALIVEDIDGDGLNEVIIGNRERKPVQPSTVHAFDYDGALRWVYSDSSDVYYDDGNDNYGHKFATRFIMIIDSNDKQKDVLVGFNHKLYFPSKLIRLSNAGEVKSTFWNSGAIDGAMFVSDFLQEKPVLLVYGTNNEYNSGFVAAFRADSLSGHSPQVNKHYIKQGEMVNQYFAYIQFPMLDTLGTYTFHRRTHVINIFPPSQEHLRIDLRGSNGEVEWLYYLDTSLTIRNLVFSDSFNGQFLSQFKDKLNSEQIWDQLVQHYSNLQYWNGNTWQRLSNISDPNAK